MTLGLPIKALQYFIDKFILIAQNLPKMGKKPHSYGKVQNSQHRSSIKNSNSAAGSGGRSSGKMSKNRLKKSENNQNSNAVKKIWSFTDLVQAMKPTPQELKFRKKKANENDIPSASSNVFKCTKCNWKFKVTSEEYEKVQVHPCLGVLMCKGCCDYYNDGEFSVDSDGEDKYCRWCGEGGTLFGCSKCICGFCKACIKKHFGKEYLKVVQKDDDWLCFFCNPEPLWNQRYICSVAIEMSKKKASAASSVKTNKRKGSENLSRSKKTTKRQIKEKQPTTCQCQLSESSSTSISLQNWITDMSCKDKKDSKKRVYSSTSDESDIASSERHPKKMKLSSFSQQPQELGQEESFESLKQIVVEKLERAVKFSEYQMAFGMKWTRKVLNKLADPRHIKTPQDLHKECLKVKFFLSALASHFLEFCNSVETGEKILPKDGSKDASKLSQTSLDPTGFSSIIKFLSFITNQVNIFVRKGFSLSEILEAEVYHDNDLIGLKTMSKPSNSSTSSESASIASSESFNENIGDSKSNPKTTKKVDETESSDEDPLKVGSDHDSKPQEESPSESEDFNSSPSKMKPKNSYQAYYADS